VGEDGDPQAHGDEGLHRVVVVAAEGEAGLEAGRSAAVEDDGSIGAVWGTADPGLAGELLEGDRRPRRQRVAVWHHEIERIVQQVGPLQLDVRFGQRLMLVDER
jgi:hypothetical protein